MGSEPTEPPPEADDPEARVERETEEQAAEGEHDPDTAREAAELGLMSADESEKGAELGDHIE